MKEFIQDCVALACLLLAVYVVLVLGYAMQPVEVPV